MNPRVHVVILNWNNAEETVKCVASLQAQDYDNLHVTVVDNGSVDGSAQVLEKLSGITLRKNARNLGFTGGCNGGIRDAFAAGADYVWLLNNDATVAPDCVSRLVETAESAPDIGLVSPVIYFAEDPQRIQHCGTRLTIAAGAFDEAPDIATARAWQERFPTQMIQWGTGLLIRRSLFEKIGVLDERFFAYSEDTDYSIRSNAAGFRNVTAFDASMWHHWPSGLRRPYYYYYRTRNDLLMWRKHLGLRGWARAIWWNRHRLLRSLADLRAHPALVDASAAGFWDGLLGRGGEYNASRGMPAAFRRLLIGK